MYHRLSKADPQQDISSNISVPCSITHFQTIPITPPHYQSLNPFCLDSTAAMYMTFAIASAILAGTAIASQDFARRDAYPDAEALISQNAHLYARDAYASAYEDAYYELSARWAEPELYLDEPDFNARDLDDHYFDERDETEEQRRAREAEEQRQRLATAKRLAAMVPQTPVPNNVIGGLQTVAKGISRRIPLPLPLLRSSPST